MVKMNEAKMTTTPKAMMDAMNAMVEEAAKDGCVMVQGVGLLPTSSGMRARLAGGKAHAYRRPVHRGQGSGRRLRDLRMRLEGADAEMDRALHGAAQDLHMPGWEGECEVRQIPDPGQEVCGKPAETRAAAE